MQPRLGAMAALNLDSSVILCGRAAPEAGSPSVGEVRRELEQRPAPEPDPDAGEEQSPQKIKLRYVIVRRMPIAS